MLRYTLPLVNHLIHTIKEKIRTGISCQKHSLFNPRRDVFTLSKLVSLHIKAWIAKVYWGGRTINNSEWNAAWTHRHGDSVQNLCKKTKNVTGIQNLIFFTFQGCLCLLTDSFFFPLTSEGQLILSFRIIICTIKHSPHVPSLRLFWSFLCIPQGLLEPRQRGEPLLTRRPRCLDAKLGANRRDQTDPTLGWYRSKSEPADILCREDEEINLGPKANHELTDPLEQHEKLH